MTEDELKAKHEVAAHWKTHKGLKGASQGFGDYIVHPVAAHWKTHKGLKVRTELVKGKNNSSRSALENP